MQVQGVEELIAYWTLESSEDTLEELEETLIVRSSLPLAGPPSHCCKHAAQSSDHLAAGS